MPDTNLAAESRTSPILGKVAEPAEMRDFAVSGMTCASCVARVEKVLKRVDGVESVSVNLATEKARILAARWVDDAAMAGAVAKAGYGARRLGGAAPMRDAHRWDGLMLALAALLSLPLILPMVTGGLVTLPVLLAFALATIVQFGPGARFYVAGWKSLRAGAGSMDVLVALGTSAAYGLSVHDMIGGGPLYFEASAVMITLIRFGKFLETRAKLLALWRDKSRASAEVKAIALAHVQDLDAKAAALSAMSASLRELAEKCQGDHRPDCPILDELALAPTQDAA